MKAIVVSRSDGARIWVRRALGGRWSVSETSNGVDALSMARAEAPDLVVADESTEPFGAFGLARELKLLHEPPAVIVLLDRAQDTWLARWSGADRWLIQPVDAFALARAANEAVDATTQSGPGTDDDDEPPIERVHAVPGTPFTEAEHTER